MIYYQTRRIESTSYSEEVLVAPQRGSKLEPWGPPTRAGKPYLNRDGPTNMLLLVTGVW